MTELLQRLGRQGLVTLAQAFNRDDDAATRIVLKNCDRYSVALQLYGFLFTTFRQFDVDIEERVAIRLNQTGDKIGRSTDD